ncbi:hypothetical protein DSO57_1007972 [Entomophthora muscae]|uniref:Uncharacterized protein n=1 Tax=Entomophthora muscae TaxID=34485 RepID=A0ACC2TJ50_9FUNG|nr:hypothetical protein DSO57_1007972 [Entomophthora muscae]
MATIPFKEEKYNITDVCAGVDMNCLNNRTDTRSLGSWVLSCFFHLNKPHFCNCCRLPMPQSELSFGEHLFAETKATKTGAGRRPEMFLFLLTTATNGCIFMLVLESLMSKFIHHL